MSFVTPALLTSTSSRPQRLDGRRHQALGLLLVADVGLEVARIGEGVDATACPVSTEWAEFTSTEAPRRANSRATCSPMPLDEPVTITTRPAQVVSVAFLLYVACSPHVPSHCWPGSSTISPRPDRSASGAQVIGSMATARRRSSARPSVSPV